MRRTALALLIISVIAVGIPAPSTGADDVVLSGSGWGHGVGLSQYGAKGMAATGASAGQILGHYYQGTSLGTVSSSTVKSFIVSESMPLWVGVMQNETTVTFKPIGGSATVCFESGGSTDCLPTAAGQDQLWRMRVVDASTCVYEQQVGGTWTQQGPAGPCGGAVTPNGGAKISFVYLGRTYHNGVLRLRKDPDGAGVHAVWQTALEPYLKGILEMPSSWPSAALQSQAIAARSYAVARIGWRGSATSFSSSRKASCWCNLYATTYDQQFKGVAAETSSWVSAVNATAGKIVVAGGKAAETFYSSSSGGRTENNQHYWGGNAISYLQGVDDSAAHTAAAGNPHSSWSVSVSPGTVASKLGFDAMTRIRVLESYPSGSPSKIEFVGTKGGQAVVTYKTGKDVRSLFGLRSQYVSVDWSGPGGATTTTAAPTTTQPPATTTTAPTTSTEAPPTTQPGSTSTSEAPPETTTTTEAPTTSTEAPTTPEGPVTDEPIVVDTPDGPGTGESAPITNKAPEAKGAPEAVAPPPPPAPDPEPTGPTSTDRRPDVLTYDASDFERPPTTAPVPSTLPPTETTLPPPQDEVVVVASPVVVDADKPEPTTVGKAAYEVAAEFGSWVARLSTRIVSAASE